MNRRRIGPLLAVVWLGVIVSGYVLVHFPITAGIAAALLQTGLGIVAVIALVILGGAIGALITPDLSPLSDLERASVQALLGLALISFLAVVLGLLGLFPPRWLAWLLIAAALGGLHRQVIAWARSMWNGLRGVITAQDEWHIRAIQIAMLVLIVMAVILALLPETKWDALTYHLVAPDWYLKEGRIFSYPENHFFGFPQLVEMLFLWVMVLAGPNAAALINGMFGLLLLSMLLGLLNRYGKPAVGWVVVAMLLISDSVWGQFFWAYNDLAYMAYTLAAIILILAWGRDNNRPDNRLLILSGVMTGCMMGVKYLAAPFTIGIGLLSVWLTYRSGWKKAVTATGLLVLIALLAFAPWLLKNLIIDGNPVSPFIWGTSGYDEIDQYHYLRPQTGLKIGNLLLLPIQLAIFGTEGGVFQGSTGALLFGLPPLALIGWRRRDEATRGLITGLFIAVLPGFLTWLAGGVISEFLVGHLRYIFPMLPALAVIGALGFDGLGSSSLLTDLYNICRVIILVMVAFGLVVASLIFIRMQPLRVLVGLQSEEDYLLEKLQAYYFTMQQINDLPEDASVLFLWEPRTMYCEDRCTPDSLIDQWWHDERKYGDLAAIAENWRSRGFTHVLVYETGGRFLIEEDPLTPLTEDDWQALDTLRGTELIPVWDELDSYTLYRLAD
ncbi:MAG: hypothetical protein JXJ17_04865 [Anaerolineae bacterium]|nr:hypothetical protein [Anaerolineae bacterium]